MPKSTEATEKKHRGCSRFRPQPLQEIVHAFDYDKHPFGVCWWRNLAWVNFRYLRHHHLHNVFKGTKFRTYDFPLDIGDREHVVGFHPDPIALV